MGSQDTAVAVVVLGCSGEGWLSKPVSLEVTLVEALIVREDVVNSLSVETLDLRAEISRPTRKQWFVFLAINVCRYSSPEPATPLQISTFPLSSMQTVRN
jgi:hypothetical protein